MTILLPLLLLANPAPTWEKNVTFATVGRDTVQFDAAIPAGSGPFPCVVVFHGGAWKYGSRADTAGFAKQLAENGYVGVTASYRLAPKYKWPAQIEDAKTVVRFLRANAAKYKLDPAKLGVLGFSAGGHLAAMLGTTDKDAGFDGGLFPNESSRPQCVVDYFGPADLPLYAESPGIEAAYFRSFLGGRFKDVPEVYKKASPMEYASKNAAPILIVHGTADVIVPVIHSERFHKKLTEAGAASELITVPGMGHGWGGAESERTTAATLKFLAKQLKGTP